MKTLPIGVYAVSSEFAEKTGAVSFTFKGVEYEAEVGVNAFERPEHLSQITPVDAKEEFCGYKDIPIVVVPAGEHKIKIGRESRFRNFLPCALALLGENAGISPNAEDLCTPNPQRGDESVFVGTMYTGVIAIEGNALGTLIVDGLSFKTSRVYDERTGGNDLGLVVKNCTFTDFLGYDLIKSFALEDPAAKRFIHLSDIRCDGIESMNCEGRLVGLGCGNLTVERLYFANTRKFMGLTNFSRTELAGRPKEDCAITYRDCLFENCECFSGMNMQFHENAGKISIEIDNCRYFNTTLPGIPVFSIHLPNADSTLTIKDCSISGSDNIPAIEIIGCKEAKINLSGSDQTGFTALMDYKAPRRTIAPCRINEVIWDDLEDPHAVIENADFSGLDKLYTGRKPYHGDFHTHTNSGGSSDGNTPLAEFIQQLKELNMDFAAIVDHKQMRHFFLPEWDETMCICGTEPGLGLSDRSGINRSLHYTMIFPDKTGLAKVFEEFPEFEFTGTPEEGRYIYYKFNTKRFFELGEYIWSIGGLMSHAHPRQVMVSDDPMDYYFGEHVAIETVHDSADAFSTQQNRDLWEQLLKMGKRVHTHGSSDTHREAKNCAQTTVYAPKRYSTDIFNVIRSGDCVAGAVGIQMSIDDCVMGGSIPYREGQQLLIKLGHFHPACKLPDTVYCLKVYTDQGLAYATEFDGEMPQELAIPVKKRNYYRVEITNESDHLIVALSNPIWLD